MIRLPTYLPLVAAVAVVTGWAVSRPDVATLPSVEAAGAAWMVTQSLPPGHPPIDGAAPALPEGHPPIGRGELGLPPGHPPVCPGRGRIPGHDMPGRAASPQPEQPPLVST
jgi:hypothetical protein